MTTYEYKIISPDETLLNELSAQGWRVVGVGQWSWTNNALIGSTIILERTLAPIHTSKMGVAAMYNPDGSRRT